VNLKIPVFLDRHVPLVLAMTWGFRHWERSAAIQSSLLVMSNKILIVKLGALGDMVQAASAFAALRQFHKKDHVTLLTSAPYLEFARRMGYFDDILLDERLKFYQIQKILKFCKALRRGGFQKVYDLQDVDRTKIYAKLLGPETEWITSPKDDRLIHPQDRFERLFKTFKIPFRHTVNLSHLAELFTSLPRPYALLVPGASMAHGGAKRWPEERYAELAIFFKKQGITSVLIGGSSETFNLIRQRVPGIVDLCGQTNFYQVIGLAQKAAFAVGNDTGPMLLAASSGCPTLTLYSDKNPPSLGGARGPNHLSLHVPSLQDLKMDTVAQKLSQFLSTLG